MLWYDHRSEFKIPELVTDVVHILCGLSFFQRDDAGSIIQRNNNGKRFIVAFVHDKGRFSCNHSISHRDNPGPHYNYAVDQLGNCAHIHNDPMTGEGAKDSTPKCREGPSVLFHDKRFFVDDIDVEL